MMITCPSCTVSYDVEDDAMGDGRTVQCTWCGSIWDTRTIDRAIRNLHAKGIPQNNLAPQQPAIVPARQDTRIDRDMPEQQQEQDSADHSDDRIEATIASIAATIGEPGAEKADATQEFDNAEPTRTLEVVADDADRTPSLQDPIEEAIEQAISRSDAGDNGEGIEQSDAAILADTHDGDYDPTADTTRHVDNKTRWRLRRKAPSSFSSVIAELKQGNRRTGMAGLAAIFVMVLTLATFVTGAVYREAVVRTTPGLASLYGALGMPVNLRDLEFKNIALKKDTNDNMPILIVTGQVTNLLASAQPLPAIRLALRGTREQELYAWTVRLDEKQIGANETLEFRSRLALPPADAHDVLVRFIDPPKNKA